MFVSRHQDTSIGVYSRKCEDDSGEEGCLLSQPALSKRIVEGPKRVACPAFYHAPLLVTS